MPGEGRPHYSRAVIERLRSTRLDAALAAALVVAGLVQVVLLPIAATGVGELYVVGTTLPLAWRRTFPLPSSLTASAFWLVPLDGFPILGFVVVILQFFALGTHGRPRWAVALVATWASALTAVGTLLGPEPAVAAIGAVLAVVGPVLAGVAVHHERRQRQGLAELATELHEERLKAEEAAVGAERARIARELHDVVGHEVTLIAIQAEAAAVALRTRPERASESVEAIRTTAHRTLTEIRSLLGLLGPPDARHESEGPAELAARARAAGIANDLVVSGTPPTSHAPVTLAVNRIVRECLTNAGRHAPGQPVSLAVDWHPDAVSVTATNRTDRRSHLVPGRGLTGVRHRAELLGGTFAAAVVDGRFEVRVRIPMGSTP